MCLFIITFHNVKRNVNLQIKDRVTIGRDETKNQIIIDDRSVSGVHCEMFIKNEVLILRDVGSSTELHAIVNQFWVLYPLIAVTA